MRGALGDNEAMAYSSVLREAIVSKMISMARNQVSFADLWMHGLFQPQTEALLDVHVIDYHYVIHTIGYINVESK